MGVSFYHRDKTDCLAASNASLSRFYHSGRRKVQFGASCCRDFLELIPKR